MTDYEALVDNIQSILCADGEPKLPALSALATEYVAAVEEVNDRLKKCDAMLHKGHRAEALQMCDIEPRMTDVVGILDFAAREQWADYLRQFGLPSPPEVLFDVAGELNEAYMAEEPVLKLMRLHRLYALGRVPLCHRIDVVRKIAATDSGNPIWDEDLRTFEKARHNQLGNEATLAIKGSDLDAIAALERELRDATWLVPPPKSIVERVTQAHTKLRAQQARLELANVEGELTAAYSSLDPDRARGVRTRWNKLVAIAALPPDDPLQELAAPTLEWLAAEDQKVREQAEYDQNVAALQQALDEGLPQLELERLWHAAIQRSRVLPAVVESRLAERLRYLAERDARRSKLRIVGLVAAIVLIGGLTATAIYQQSRSRELAHYAANLKQLLDDGKLVEAGKYLGDMAQAAPDAADSPEIKKLRGDLEHAEDRDAGRRALRQQSFDAAQKDGVDHPQRETFETVDKELNKALEASATDTERSQVVRLQREVRGKRDAMQAAVNAEFTESLDPFVERVKLVQPDDVNAMNALLQEGNALRRNPHAAPVILKQIDPWLRTLENKRDEFIKGQADAVALRRVHEAVGNPEAFRASLQGYVTASPGTRRSHDFERVSQQKEFDAWKGVDAWDALIRRWSAVNFSQLEPKQADELQKEAAKLLAKYKEHPASVDLTRIVAYLAAIARRVDGNGARIATQLYDALNNSTVANMMMVQTIDGKRYYNRDKPEKIEGVWNVNYFKDATLTKKGLERIAVNKVINPLHDGVLDWTAPQSAFSESAIRKLNTLNDENWDDTFLELIGDLSDAKSMEPILKFQLLSLLIDVARQGSLPLESAFARNAELIRATPIDSSVNWLNPDDKAAATLRKTIEKRLAEMKKAQDAAAAAARTVADLKKPLAVPVHKWLAWLHRDREGLWTCVPAPRDRIAWAGNSGDLWVIDVPLAEERARFVKLGALKDGVFKLSEPPPNGLIEGRPVYLQVGK
ncbi:MAG: hypothetical protein EXS05_22210 [Planctomycetaceae bacterium]|nr:hypothetical protein [Planctomycetaceae bacterium]